MNAKPLACAIRARMSASRSASIAGYSADEGTPVEVYTDGRVERPYVRRCLTRRLMRYCGPSSQDDPAEPVLF